MEKKKESLTSVKRRVKEKVMKEYQTFMEGYRALPKDKLMDEMVEDAEKIAFYKRLYIIIVIIGDLYPEEWIRLDKYYFGRDIIKDFYDSYAMFRKDYREEEIEKEEEEPKGMDFTAYLSDLTGLVFPLEGGRRDACRIG